MKNTYIGIIALIVLVGGGLIIFANSKKVQVPTDNMGNMEMPKDTSASSVKEFTISGQNFSFMPSTITVKKGDKVKITFKNTSGFHDFKIDEFGVAAKKTQSPTEEVLEFTADKAGSFEYYCSVGSHRSMGMKGTLKVE